MTLHFKQIPITIIVLISLAVIGCGNTDKDLYQAVTAGNYQKVQSLINEGANVDYANANGKTPLIEAVYFSNNASHYKIMELLINSGADINASTTEYGTTALFMAVQLNYARAVKLLLENDADPTATLRGCYNGRTVLMTAAANRSPNPRVSPDIVKLLIEYGADVTARDEGGKTALMWAEENGRKDIAAILKHNI